MSSFCLYPRISMRWPRARGVGLSVSDVAGRWRSGVILLTPYTPFEDGRCVSRARDYT